MKVALCGIEEAKQQLVEDVFSKQEFKSINPICKDMLNSLKFLEQLRIINDIEKKKWNNEDKFVTIFSAIDALVDMMAILEKFGRDDLLECFDEACKHLDEYDIIFYCQPTEYDSEERYARDIKRAYMMIGWMHTNIKPTAKVVAVTGPRNIRKNIVTEHLKRAMEKKGEIHD